jgi:hypothetical protein
MRRRAPSVCCEDNLIHIPIRLDEFQLLVVHQLDIDAIGLLHFDIGLEQINFFFWYEL